MNSKTKHYKYDTKNSQFVTNTDSVFIDIDQTMAYEFQNEDMQEKILRKEVDNALRYLYITEHEKDLSSIPLNNNLTIVSVNDETSKSSYSTSIETSKTLNKHTNHDSNSYISKPKRINADTISSLSTNKPQTIAISNSHSLSNNSITLSSSCPSVSEESINIQSINSSTSDKSQTIGSLSYSLSSNNSVSNNSLSVPSYSLSYSTTSTSSNSHSPSNSIENSSFNNNSNGYYNILNDKTWKRPTRDTEYIPYFGNQLLFNDPTYGIRLFPNRKNPKVLISVTIYNETFNELNDSIRGIADNIENLPEYSYGLTADDIVVFVIFDGREKVHPSIFERREDDKQYLSEEDFECMSKTMEENNRIERAWNLYKPILSKKYNDREIKAMTQNLPLVQMHLFKCYKCMMKGSLGNVSYYSPFDIVFAIKEHNRGKLSSHFWILRVFCRQLVPDYVTLLDVGTKPMSTSLIQLYNEMDENPQIGGCCGEITTDNAPKTSPVMAAQYFEYKVSHFLEKAMESVFGYVSVLPGAFSAYRYEALQGTPLDKYFFLEDEHNRLSVDPFSANMYLAEDRIMGFEMLVKKNHNYTLHFISTAIATTDIPPSLNLLIRQRRRWLNGSFFASLYAIKEWPRLYTESSHSLGRKFMLTTQLLYFAINQFMTIMQLANVFLTFAVVVRSSFASYSKVAVFVLDSCYLIVTALQFVYALGNDPRDNREVYRLSYITYGCLSILSLALTFFSIEKFNIFMLLSAALSIFVILLGSIIHGEVFKILPCMLQYLFMLPTFMNINIIYSFCNVHDVSWGTRDSNIIQNPNALEQVEVKYKQFRSKLVLFWACINWLFVGYVFVFEAYDMFGLMLTAVIYILFSYRLFGSITYQLVRFYKYYVKHHSSNSRSRLFILPIDEDNNIKSRYDDSEEKKRLLVELSKVIPDYDKYIPEYRSFLSTIDIFIIYDFMFHTYATWYHHNEYAYKSQSTDISSIMSSQSTDSRSLSISESTRRRKNKSSETFEDQKNSNSIESLSSIQTLSKTQNSISTKEMNITSISSGYDAYSSLTKSYSIPNNSSNTYSLQSKHISHSIENEYDITGFTSSSNNSTNITDEENSIQMFLGRSDFEKLVIEMCYLKTKSRCSTLSNRMFDKYAHEIYVSKSINGPTCNLLMLGYNEFITSFKEIIRMEYMYPKNMSTHHVLRKFIQENLGFSPPLLSLFKSFKEEWKNYD